MTTQNLSETGSNASQREEERSATILAVDDNVRNAKLLDGMLTPHGYNVILAYSGPEALDLVAQHSPDLIILDVLMPGMDGFEVAQAVRARPESRAIPILMLTALHEIEHKAQALKSGADDFLSKPFSLADLLARVHALLRLKRLQDELVLKNKLLEKVLGHSISEQESRQILAGEEP